jgi:hypothetical protein
MGAAILWGMNKTPPNNDQTVSNAGKPLDSGVVPLDDAIALILRIFEASGAPPELIVDSRLSEALGAILRGHAARERLTIAIERGLLERCLRDVVREAREHLTPELRERANNVLAGVSRYRS